MPKTIHPNFKLVVRDSELPQGMTAEDLAIARQPGLVALAHIFARYEIRSSHLQDTPERRSHKC